MSGRHTMSEHARRHVAELGENVRTLEALLLEAREAFAGAVTRFLPPTATGAEVARFVEASGFSRALVDSLREDERHPWRRVPD